MFDGIIGLIVPLTISLGVYSITKTPKVLKYIHASLIILFVIMTSYDFIEYYNFRLVNHCEDIRYIEFIESKDLDKKLSIDEGIVITDKNTIKQFCQSIRNSHENNESIPNVIWKVDVKIEFYNKKKVFLQLVGTEDQKFSLIDIQAGTFGTLMETLKSESLSGIIVNINKDN